MAAGYNNSYEERSSADDYPPHNSRAGSQPGALLKETIGGAPVVASRVVGRTRVQGPDEALEPEAAKNIAGAYGAYPQPVNRRSIGGDAGRFIRSGLPIKLR